LVDTLPSTCISRAYEKEQKIKGIDKAKIFLILLSPTHF